MSVVFTQEQIDDLLHNVLDVPKVNQWKKDIVQFCCPIHHETHPSCGIILDKDGETKFNCFSCGEHGTIARMLYKSLPDRFKNFTQASLFLKKRYGVSARFINSKNDLVISRYEDQFIDIDKTDREIKPLTMIAPFRSGKETYKYFFSRGFDKEDMKKFKIGRDLENKTVTIPIFWEDNKLAGVIGRYIDKNRPKNMRFMIYKFKRSSLIYPLDKVKADKDTLILVEACFDVIMLHKWGYENAVATMTNKVSREQADQIADRCKKLIVLCDNDEMGKELLITAKRYLNGRVEILRPTYIPEEGKDPCEWGEEETTKVIESATRFGFKKLPRRE